MLKVSHIYKATTFMSSGNFTSLSVTVTYVVGLFK